MRAVAAFPATREVRIIERPEPDRPNGAQVLLRILEVGVCGTDREIGAFEYGSPPPGCDYLVLGHEALAEVADTGPDVTSFHRGDLVVPTVRLPCPHDSCRPCRVERQDFCTSGDFRECGIKEAHGFLQEWVLEDEDHLVAVPKPLADVAVLTEPLTVAAKAAEQAHAIQDRLPWDPIHVRALVLGAGPVGLLGAVAMKVNGVETYVYSREPANGPRALRVSALGATYISADDIPIEQLGDAVGPLHAIYEAVGVSSVAFSAIHALGPNGILIVTGVPALGAPKAIDTDAILRNIVLKNQVIVGTVNAGRSAYALALQKLEQGMFLYPESMRGFITERAPIDEAPAMISTRDGIKQVVEFAKVAV